MTLKFTSKNGKSTISQAVIIIAISVVFSVLISAIVNNKLTNNSVSEEQVITYIENNAGKVIDALNNYYRKKAQADLKNRDKTLAEHKERFDSDDIPSIGNKNAKVTLVEFFDYNCGYCKKVFPTINKAIADGLDVKILFIDFPILGPASEMKAKGSIAAHVADSSKYFDMHARLMMDKGISSVDDMVVIAKQVGYDEDKFVAALNSQKVADILKSNKKLARDLSVNGTPAFIINDKFFQGALSYNTLKQKVLESN